MISVLRNWSEVGKAIGYLTRSGKDKLTRVYHSTPIKNWDLAQIAKLLQTQNRSIRILDMGCGGSHALKLCYRYGFTNCYGIDLHISWADRWQQLMLRKSNHWQMPYRLSEQSVTHTNFPNQFFDMLICLSVIEHGVNLNEFFRECARICKPGGLIYLSTDYWPKKIKTHDAPLNYGQEPDQWNIFSLYEVRQLISLANKSGFVLEKSHIPKAKQPIMHWNQKRYTFISFTFHRKSNS